MTQIPILSGIYTDQTSDYRVSYPCNLVPVAQDQGISTGYLRPADGIVQIGTGPGINRGGINWEGTLYRVMDQSFVSVAEDGTVTTLGTVTGQGRVSMFYSFDYLAIVSDTGAWLYDGNTLTQYTDPDLGPVRSGIWIDGYFMFIDDEFIVVSELTNPFAIDPLKYGSSEADPDPLKAIVKVRNEAYVLNRYTTEVFDNIGSPGFPFQRIEGAQIMKGTLGPFTACRYLDNVAMIGGGYNEASSVWLVANGQSAKIATREVDLVIQSYTEAELAETLLETRVGRDQEWLILHLPDRTLVYDARTSQQLGQPTWFYLASSVTHTGPWRVSDLVYCYNRWNVADTQSGLVGFLSDDVATHWGEPVAWEFATPIIYNEGRGAIIHELELVALTGRQALGASPVITSEYTVDGMSWSVPKAIPAGRQGQRNKRLVWYQQGNMRHWRAQRFRGDSGAALSFARLEARLEGLNF
jgi:hypothetical protein